jgi:hypothetical protein
MRCEREDIARRPRGVCTGARAALSGWRTFCVSSSCVEMSIFCFLSFDPPTTTLLLPGTATGQRGRGTTGLQVLPRHRTAAGRPPARCMAPGAMRSGAPVNEKPHL